MKPNNVTCVVDGGICPVADGLCYFDGECYIWRCSHPHSPPPQVGCEQLELPNVEGTHPNEEE